MIAFLTSSPSGPLDGSRQVDGLDRKNRFVENLKKYWKPDSRCLMITASPSAYVQNEEMTAFFRDSIEKAGLTVSKFDLWDDRTEDVSRETLHSYDAVFLGGGHVPTQNAFFQELHLRESIRDFDGIVIGISAGTMNSAETVYAQPELPGESVDPAYVRFLPGLSLTKTMILPHYQMVKDMELDGKRLYEDITYGDSYGRSFLVLPDGSYLLIEDGKETVWGEAYQITEGKFIRICGDEQKNYEFHAVIEAVPDKGGAYIRFPYDIREEFGRGRVKANITFDSEPYCGSIVNMGVKNADGSVCYIIGIRKEIQNKIGKKPGDTVFVTVRAME